MFVLFLLMLLWEVAVDIKTSVAGGQMIPHPSASPGLHTPSDCRPGRFGTSAMNAWL